MAIKKSQYSILVDVDFSAKGVQAKLDKLAKDIKPIKVKVDVDGAENIKNVTKGADDAAKGVDKLNKAAQDNSLTFQAANEIFSKTIDVITSMVDQVYKFDASIIEFQKVSDLSGEALDKYVDKLADMGQVVGRTGKPKSQALNVRIVN